MKTNTKQYFLFITYVCTLTARVRLPFKYFAGLASFLPPSDEERLCLVQESLRGHTHTNNSINRACVDILQRPFVNHTHQHLLDSFPLVLHLNAFFSILFKIC